MPLTDYEVAEKLQRHDSTCKYPETKECTCGREEYVQNTYLILKAIRTNERRACEAISRECGGARASDRIRDRDKDAF